MAFLTLAPLLGTAAASILFAVALLASGQSSTITGTLAGQVVMEGFMHWRISAWLRRLITRLIAILPAIFVIGIRGVRERERPARAQPSRAGPAASAGDVPAHALHQLASAVMGKWKNGWFLLPDAGWGSAILITALDIYGLPDAMHDAWRIVAPRQRSRAGYFRYATG